MLNLAEQFIAAMPARIKNEGEIDALMLDMSSQVIGNNGGNSSNFGSTCSPLICDNSQSDDLGIESMVDDLEYDFDFNLQVNTYSDLCTLINYDVTQLGLFFSLYLNIDWLLSGYG